MEWLTAENLTMSGLLLGGVAMLMWGLLVPSKFYNEKKAEAERWREAYEKERLARSTSEAQSKELLEVAKTTNEIVSSIFGGK